MKEYFFISILGTYKKPNLPVSLSCIVKSLLRRFFVRLDISEYFVILIDSL